MRRRWPLLAGAALLVLATEASARVTGFAPLDRLPPGGQFALLCAGVALVVWGLARGETFAAPRPGREAALLAALTLAALGLRLWRIDEAIRVLVDELQFVGGVLSFWKPNEIVPLLKPMTGVSPFTWLYAYWQSLAADTFGHSLGSLRGVSAVLGALTVPALYMLARALFDRRAAWLAALLLAVFPPHLHFSRIALLSIADPLFGTLGLAFLARGLARGRRLDYALGGACLGLTAYFYDGGRLLFPVLAGLWAGLYGLFNRRAETSLAPARGGLLAALAAFALVGLPVYALLAGGGGLSGRWGASALNGEYWLRLLTAPPNEGLAAAHIERHMLPPFLFYVALRDATPYYGGDWALTLPPLAPLFLLGVAAGLRRGRRAGGLLALLWLLLTALGSSLLVVSHASTRYVVAFPAVALALALGLDAALRFVERRAGLRERARRAVVLAAAAACVAVQAGYYFGPHLAQFDARLRATRPHLDIEDAVYRALDLPPDVWVHFVGSGLFDPGYGQIMLAYLRPEQPVTGYMAEAFVPEVAVLTGRVPHAFFIEPDDAATLAALRARFAALDGPFFSPHALPPARAFVLYTAGVEG